MDSKVFLELEGNANELLLINNDNSMRCTRLIDLDENSKNYDEEIIDICITSTNMYGNHKKFDKLLDKKIKITVEIVE